MIRGGNSGKCARRGCSNCRCTSYSEVTRNKFDAEEASYPVTYYTWASIDTIEVLERMFQVAAQRRGYLSGLRLAAKLFAVVGHAHT